MFPSESSSQGLAVVPFSAQLQYFHMSPWVVPGTKQQAVEQKGNECEALPPPHPSSPPPPPPPPPPRVGNHKQQSWSGTHIDPAFKPGLATAETCPCNVPAVPPLRSPNISSGAHIDRALFGKTTETRGCCSGGRTSSSESSTSPPFLPFSPPFLELSDPKSMSPYLRLSSSVNAASHGHALVPSAASLCAPSRAESSGFGDTAAYWYLVRSAGQGDECGALPRLHRSPRRRSCRAAHRRRRRPRRRR